MISDRQNTRLKKEKISKFIFYLDKLYSYSKGWFFGMMLGRRGSKCSIARSAKIIKPHKVFLGNRVKIYENVIISAAWKTGSIYIADGTRIHQYASIFTFGGEVYLKDRVGINFPLQENGTIPFQFHEIVHDIQFTSTTTN